MRIFLDTNVLVSAFATRGLCTDVLITGDRDLLDLRLEVHRPVIIEPRRFWDLEREREREDWAGRVDRDRA